MKSKIFTYSYQECGCVNPNEWTTRWIAEPSTNRIIAAPPCNFSDTCYSAASMRLSESTPLWNQFCSHCYDECSSSSFIITVSSVEAPSSYYANMTKAFVESLSVPLPTNWSTDWLSEVQNNYVSLEVVCDSTKLENFTQDPLLSVVGIVSRIGGHTGLWLGVSFLSIMGFVEMLYHLLRYEYQTVRRLVKKTIW